jgi:hypothetical protein
MSCCKESRHISSFQNLLLTHHEYCTHLPFAHDIHFYKILGETSVFRVLFLRSANCISLGCTVGDVSKCTTFRRQLPLCSPQLTGTFKVGGGRCAHCQME